MWYTLELYVWYTLYDKTENEVSGKFLWNYDKTGNEVSGKFLWNYDKTGNEVSGKFLWNYDQTGNKVKFTYFCMNSVTFFLLLTDNAHKKSWTRILRCGNFPKSVLCFSTFSTGAKNTSVISAVCL